MNHHAKRTVEKKEKAEALKKMGGGKKKNKKMNRENIVTSSERIQTVGSGSGEAGDELGPDPTICGGAELRRDEMVAAQRAGEVELEQPAVEAVAVEGMAAGEAADAVAVGEAAEADGALRADVLAAGEEEGEGSVGGEVVGEEGEAREAGS